LPASTGNRELTVKFKKTASTMIDGVVTSFEVTQADIDAVLQRYGLKVIATSGDRTYRVEATGKVSAADAVELLKRTFIVAEVSREIAKVVVPAAAQELIVKFKKTASTMIDGVVTSFEVTQADIDAVLLRYGLKVVETAGDRTYRVEAAGKISAAEALELLKRTFIVSDVQPARSRNPLSILRGNDGDVYGSMLPVMLLAAAGLVAAIFSVKIAITAALALLTAAAIYAIIRDFASDAKHMLVADESTLKNQKNAVTIQQSDLDKIMALPGVLKVKAGTLKRIYGDDGDYSIGTDSALIVYFKDQSSRDRAPKIETETLNKALTAQKTELAYRVLSQKDQKALARRPETKFEGIAVTSNKLLAGNPLQRATAGVRKIFAQKTSGVLLLTGAAGLSLGTGALALMAAAAGMPGFIAAALYAGTMLGALGFGIGNPKGKNPNLEYVVAGAAALAFMPAFLAMGAGITMLSTGLYLGAVLTGIIFAMGFWTKD
jgi:hypothetical protein